MLTGCANERLAGRTRAGRCCGLLVACLVGWSAAEARAAGPTPAPASASDPAASADGELAKQLFQQGQSEYDLAHFKEALSLFEQAYKKKNVAALLYNIAQCHRQLGDLKMARATYKAFLAKQPSSPFATLAIEKLAEVEQVLAGQTQAQTAAPTGLAPAGPLERKPEETPPPPAPKIVRVQEPETKPATAPVKSEPAAPAPVAAAPAAPARAEPAVPDAAKAPGKAEPVKTAGVAQTKSAETKPKPAPAGATGARPAPTVQEEGGHTWAWVSGGAAALALGGGVVFALQSKSTSSEISGTEHTGAQVKQLQGDLSSQSAKANLLLGVGAGLAALSAACFYFNF